MTTPQKITFEEYQLLRSELDENVKKQDELNNAIFTVLGLSLVLNNWLENVLFLIVIILISAVLLSRIIHCRNTVYYLSAYLSTSEGLNCCYWEKRINSFKDKILAKNNFTYKKHIFINFIFRCAFAMKNFGNVILCCFVFIQISNLLMISEDELYVKIILFSAAILALALNLVFTVIICVDRKVKKQYIQIWEEIINGEEKQ